MKILSIKLFQIIFYYILTITGLATVSWILWASFIRERTIRDIPDYLLTEYRVWILFSICVTYLFIVKSLIFPREANILVKQLNILYNKPLITLDHFIKYNKYLKPYYYRSMFYFAKGYNDSFNYRYVFAIIFFFQVFPRIILVLFLLADTFWFHKLEIFYKVVLIGLFPLFYRYVKYSIKDVYEHWILMLEEKYKSVLVYEKGYKFDKSRVGNTEAVFHDQKQSIREYIEIKRDNELCNLINKEDFEYDASPYLQDEIFEKYNFNKYNTTEYSLSLDDFKYLKALYYELFPNIMRLRRYIDNIDVIEEYKTIKWSKVIIFTLYFISWFWILFISYKTYPINLCATVYLLFVFVSYLSDENNPFMETDWGSKSKNLITLESVKAIMNLVKKYYKKDD